MDKSFSEWIVFRCVNGRAITLDRAHWWTHAIRCALMELADDPPPEMLSGHNRDGGATTRPHIAIAPLPDTTSPADGGSVAGFAVAIPTRSSAADRAAVRHALDRLKRVFLGDLGACDIEPITPDDAAAQPPLQSAPFLAPASRWATVTPMLLDRFPKISPTDRERAEQNLAERDHIAPSTDNAYRRLLKSEAQAVALDRETLAIVGDSCERIGIPRPTAARAAAT